jgi:hypothetical protein
MYFPHTLCPAGNELISKLTINSAIEYNLYNDNLTHPILHALLGSFQALVAVQLARRRPDQPLLGIVDHPVVHGHDLKFCRSIIHNMN